MHKITTLSIILTLFINFTLLAEEKTDTTKAAEPHFSIDVKDMDVRDAIRLISKGYGLNIVLDREVTGKVTLHLADVGVTEGLEALVNSYDWELTKNGNVYQIGKPAEKSSYKISVSRGFVTADIKNMKVEEFINEMSQKAGISIVPENSLTGRVSAKLFRISVKDALETILEGNGYKVNHKKNIYFVSSGEGNSKANSQQRLKSGRGTFSVDISGDELTLSVINGELNALIQEISDESEMEIVIYGKLSGQVNARLNGCPIEEALALILGGTKYTFVKRAGIILIGDRNGATPSGMTLTKSELIHMRHIKADEVPKILPRNIPATAVKVVKEQNALLVSGTSEDIVKIRAFLRSIDIPTPQVALDVLVVEYSREIGKDMGFKFSGNHPEGQGGSNYYSFPSLQANRTGDAAKELLTSVFGSQPFITSLSADFAMSLKLLEEQKRAKVLAQPFITVLNGNKAKIDVGTTSYFKVIGGTADAPTQNFKPINSGITVNITPWISRSGQITAEINPEISNATGINEEGYPDISRRSITTTVRFNDGETLVLGGLLKSEETKAHSQVPILGDIPILGFLFKSTTKRQVQSNLVIYITPHIIDDNDFVDLPLQLEMLEKENNRVWLRKVDDLIIEKYKRDHGVIELDTVTAVLEIEEDGVEMLESSSVDLVENIEEKKK